MLNELNETEVNYVIGVLCKHMLDADSRLDKELTISILGKMLEGSHRHIVINHLQRFNRKETS